MGLEEFNIETHIFELHQTFPEASDETSILRTAVFNGIEWALNQIHEQYDGSLEQHNTDHTLFVVKETIEMLKLGHEQCLEEITERDIYRGALAAASHDIRQFWEIVDDDEGNPTRRMKTVENEDASANDVALWMDQYNIDNQQEIFTVEDIVIVTDAIDRTVPEMIVTDGGVKTLHQRTEDAGAVALALLLADGTSAGRDPDRFFNDGDRLLLEQNPAILESVVRGAGAVATGARDLILGWTKFQVDFARGRMEIIRDEIESSRVPVPFRSVLLEYFDAFDQTIVAAEERFRERSQMDIAQLIASLRLARYNLFTPEN